MSNNHPWYKRFPADYLASTARLTLEENGAFTWLLDTIYDQQGPLDDDPNYLAGVCHCSVRKWKTLRESLINKGKIHSEDGQIHNFRARKELENSAKTKDKRKITGSLGGRKTSENRKKDNENNNSAVANTQETEQENTLYAQKHIPEAISYIESHASGVAGKAGTDFSKNKTGKTWLWSEGIDHLIRTTNKNQQQASSSVGHLLKLCSDKPDVLVDYFISALKNNVDDIVGHIKAQIQIDKSTTVDGSREPLITISIFHPMFKNLSDRYKDEKGKPPLQVHSKSWFPKSWFADLKKEDV